MKKKTLFIISFWAAIGILIYTKNKETHHGLIDSSPILFTKENNNAVTKLNLENKSINNREIKNVITRIKNSPHFNLDSYPQREKRILIGINAHFYEDETHQLPMQNKIDLKWKEKLGGDLLNFQLPGTKVVVKEELPVIKVEDNQGKYMQQVVITFIKPNGEETSFHGLVNSENGKVEETWDRTIIDHFHRRPANLEAIPMEGVKGY